MMMRLTLVLAFLSFCLIFAGHVSAQTEPTDAETTDEKGAVEKTRDWLSDSVLQSATGVDSFFNTERYSWEDNKSRVTLRGNFDFVDVAGFKFKPGVKIKLAMPGFKGRMQLIVNEGSDDGVEGGAPDANESNAAMRFVAKSTEKFAISFDLGITTRGDPTVQFFGRANLRRTFRLSRKWDGRLENRVYWYTQSKWRNDFRWYFERGFSDKFFFRSRTRFDYAQDKDSNVFPQQKFTLFQKINTRTALAYEVIAEEIFFDDSVFDRDEFLQPCGEKCTHLQLRLRFRQNVGYPWLFYEVWPIAAWTEERDYEFTPAVRFRLEIVLGKPPKSTRLHE